jgi:hypothetical protein
MRFSPAFGAVAKEFVELKKAISSLPLVKDAQGDKAMYMKIGTLLATIEPELHARGWTLVQGEDDAIDPSLALGALRVRTMLIHTGGEWIENVVTIPLLGAQVSESKQKLFEMLKGYRPLDPQAGGIALSYGRRYGLLALLGLATEDTDGARKSQLRRQERQRLLAGAAAVQPSANFPAGIMPIGEYAGVEMKLLMAKRLRRAMNAALRVMQLEEAKVIQQELKRRGDDPMWVEPTTEPAPQPKGAIAQGASA